MTSCQAMETTTNFLWGLRSLRSDIFIKPPKTDKKKDSAQRYVSFGDNGLTISVNAYGHIMLMSRYLNFGRSGFLCIDSQYYKPFYVQARAEQLLESFKDPERGLRLNIVEWSKFPNLSHGFMYDRWPRYVVNRTWPPQTDKDSPVSPTNDSSRPIGEPTTLVPGCALSIQYFCFEDTVVQKYQIFVGENGIAHDRICWGDLRLDPAVAIRSLNFVDNLDFDDDDAKIEQYSLSDSSIMMVHAIPKDHFLKEELKQHAEEEVEEGTKLRRKIEARMNAAKQPAAAALIISPFVNDRPATIVNDTCIRLEPVDGETQLVITVAYTVKLLDSDVLALLKTQKPVTVANDDPEVLPVTQSDAVQEPGPELGADAKMSPETASVLTEAHETDTVGEKHHFATKLTDYAEIRASEVMRVMEKMGLIFCEESTFRRICFSRNNDLDYIFRRNLEHILSVCSIPIPAGPTRITPSLEGPAIAITCGDIAGHRIGPRASLAAVQFLSLMLPYIDPKTKDNEIRYKRFSAETEHEKTGSIGQKVKDHRDIEAVDTQGLAKAEEPEQRKVWDVFLSQLYERTLRTLKGHVVWICVKAECSKLDAFYPHHWPDGRRIFNLSWLPAASLIDTPLQLLKILIYLRIAPGATPRPVFKLREYEIWLTMEQEWIHRRLDIKSRSWIGKLHKINGRGLYAFNSPAAHQYFSWDEDVEENPKYRLTDHVMIGTALELIRRLGLYAVQMRHLIWAHYYPQEVQSKILKRFTVEHPISKQRTLASSRWKDKTRFLLHSKDTFLFFNEGSEYLEDSKRAAERKEKAPESADPWRYADRRWTNLLDAQVYHDHFRLQDWDNPLWHALVLVLACKGTRVNNETADDLADSSRSVLLGVASYNGLFAGQLGRKNIPEMFGSEYDRDDYWFRTFDIAHVLWNIRTAIETSAFQVTATVPPAAGPLGSSNSTAKGTPNKPRQLDKQVNISNLGSSSKNQMGVVAWLDDWLQAPPAFMEFPSDSENNVTISNGDWLLTLRRVPKRVSQDVAGVIIDVPKRSQGDEIRKPQLASEDLAKQLNRQTFWDSKKRIVWLPRCDKAVAQKCFDVSSPAEKEGFAFFLKRNLDREKLFLDRTSAELNSWETELHLTFFGISSVREGSLHELESQSFLTSTTMSLRFSGDFSDRCWICYFLEPQTDKSQDLTLGERLSPNKDSGIRVNLGLLSHDYPGVKRDKRPAESWQQRKVLELLIYSKMLEELRESAGGILRAMKKLALRSHNEKSPGRISNPFQTAIEEANRLQQLGEKEDYASIAKEWRRYIQILIVVEENLIDNIEKINQWEQREEDRQNQHPRWTDRDRRNHSTTILRLTILTQRQGGDIKRLKDDIRAFRESLPSQLESIREDISFRGSQNINLFTYVTVVFLPLGFATGVLSMGGLPDHKLLMNLVYLSLAAFGLTLLGLLNARSVQKVLPLLLRFPQRLIKFIIFHRLVVPIIHYLTQREKLKEQKQQSESRKGMYTTAMLASTPGLPIADLNLPPILASDSPPRPLQPKKEDNAVQRLSRPEDWQEKYQEIMHFSISAAVRQEERKQSKMPISEETRRIHRYSLKDWFYRSKRKRDVEQGNATTKKTDSLKGSDQSSIWPSDFSGMVESYFSHPRDQTQT